MPCCVCRSPHHQSCRPAADARLVAPLIPLPADLTGLILDDSVVCPHCKHIPNDLAHCDYCRVITRRYSDAVFRETHGYNVRSTFSWGRVHMITSCISCERRLSVSDYSRISPEPGFFHVIICRACLA